MKALIYQILIMAAVWIGMLFFLEDMDRMSKMIFYLVTSWLLLLIVLLVKEVNRNRKKTE